MNLFLLVIMLTNLYGCGCGLIISLLMVALIHMDDTYSMEKLQVLSKLVAVAYKTTAKCRSGYVKQQKKLPKS